MVNIDILAENNNNFGSKMYMIAKYPKQKCDIYFPDYDWIAKNKSITAFNKGSIQCPYEPRTFNVGYLGEGPYKTRHQNQKAGEKTLEYSTWSSMIRRCNDYKFLEREPSYQNCTIYEDWYNYQNFGYWFTENYYEVPNEKMQLDKDILIKGNKEYGPSTCCFVPHHINSLFTSRKNNRGDLPIGVYKTNGKDDKYSIQCNTMFGDKKLITRHGFTSIEDAFFAYKELKENEIKKVADYYQQYIPNELYKALYNWEVEIND